MLLFLLNSSVIQRGNATISFKVQRPQKPSLLTSVRAEQFRMCLLAEANENLVRAKPVERSGTGLVLLRVETGELSKVRRAEVE